MVDSAQALQTRRERLRRLRRRRATAPRLLQLQRLLQEAMAVGQRRRRPPQQLLVGFLRSLPWMLTALHFVP